MSPTSSTSTTSEDKINSRMYQLTAMTLLYLAGGQPEDTPNASSDSASPQSCQQLANPGRQLPPTKNRRKHRCLRFRLLSFFELSHGQFRPDNINGTEERMLEMLPWPVGRQPSHSRGLRELPAPIITHHTAPSATSGALYQLPRHD